MSIGYSLDCMGQFVMLRWRICCLNLVIIGGCGVTLGASMGTLTWSDFLERRDIARERPQQ